MKVEELRIVDVVRSDEFRRELSEKLEAMQNVREKAKTEYGSRLASHPIDYFIQRGCWNAETIASFFEDVLDKRSVLPRSKRDFVLSVCIPIFKKVMQKLIENEKKSEEKPKKPKKKRNFVSNNTTPTKQ